MGSPGFHGWVRTLGLGVIAGCSLPAGPRTDVATSGMGFPEPAGSTSTGPGDDASAAESEGDQQGCATDQDCDRVPGLSRCETRTGRCVSCLGHGDCTPREASLRCDDGLCRGCTADEQCPSATTCQSGTCAPSCDSDALCPAKLSCCGTCVDFERDAQNCGGCGRTCELPQAEGRCEAGECAVQTCETDYADCNRDPRDGCETLGECRCEPGAVQECYSGPAGTSGIGPCRDGIQVCNPFGTAWGPCTNEITPLLEVCRNGLDDDCDGAIDEDPDADGDGWTVCGGDCCDEPGAACLTPNLVNPGAFDVAGNDVDDDCDGTADNPLLACDQGLLSNGASPLNYAYAMDLCQRSEENPSDPRARRWGVVSANLRSADGTGFVNVGSRSVRDGFGANITNRFGERLVVLSTGRAADNFDDESPGYIAFQLGYDAGTWSEFPADWYATNGNRLPSAPGCRTAEVEAARDPVMLQLRVRVPTNANSFSVDMDFFSAEYPEYVCTPFNDFFVALVDSTSDGNPADKNIAIYREGEQTWPVGVNILAAAEGLFTACYNGTISQCGTPTTYSGCFRPAHLEGTGFDAPGATNHACESAGTTGGATGWLTMRGNVTPGEIMEIRFAIWDSGDSLFDSLVLLDNWQWSVEASEPGVAPG